MKVVRHFHIDTENARFSLTIIAKPDGQGFIGEYVGTTPKFAQEVRPGEPTPTMKEIGSGKLEDKDIERLVADCRTEIEDIDGEILSTIERAV
jgi:hypothetical protein